jgi:hypothetical protein
MGLWSHMDGSALANKMETCRSHIDDSREGQVLAIREPDFRSTAKHPGMAVRAED